MSTSYVKIFNELINDFLTELIEIFPENNAIKVKLTLFQTIIKLNVKKPCTDFMIKITPYLEKIAMKDESVFLGNDSPDIIDKLQLCKQDLNNLSDNTKNALWRYIKMFITVGFKIIEMPSETHTLINYIINN